MITHANTYLATMSTARATQRTVRSQTMKKKEDLPPLNKDQIDFALKKIDELHPLYETKLTDIYPLLTRPYNLCFGSDVRRRASRFERGNTDAAIAAIRELQEDIEAEQVEMGQRNPLADDAVLDVDSSESNQTSEIEESSISEDNIPESQGSQ